MPLPTPRKGEKQDDFMARCMHEAYGSGAPEDRTQEQAVAMCFSQWREAHGGSAPKELDELIAKWKEILAKQPPDNGNGCPEVGDDESHEEYMDRCTEDNDEDECQLKWEDSRSARGVTGAVGPQCDTGPLGQRVVHKTHAETVQGMEFCLSDESIDRMGDTISADGWELDAFKKNPIALFNHLPTFPIGRWEDLRVDKDALKGRLVMAPLGTSNRIDEIRKLIDAGILKAVSVGFRDIESVPLDKKNPFSGRRFIKQELVETSLVSVPANSNALAISKSLGISPATLDLVFAKHGNQDQTKKRGFTGKHAETSRKNGGRVMTPLSERISNVEALLTDSRDALREHWEGVDNTNVSDADMQKATELNTAISSLEKQHSALIESERLLAKTVSNGNGNGNGQVHRAVAIYTPPASSSGAQPEPRPAAPSIILNRKRDLDLLEYLVRAAAVGTLSKIWGKSVPETREKIYGDEEGTKVSCDLILRAPSAPAITTVTGWAAELVQQTYADLMPLLMPRAILTRLAARGLALSFGTAGRIIIPTRSRTPTLAGSFVGEGLAIPVRQGAFTTQTLVPKKLAVISTWTREMGDHSTPAIEGLIREAIQQDTSVAIDTVLIDANPATVIRPAGLLNGVAATTATAGGGLAAFIGDITALIGAVTTSTYGNVRSPVFLVNPTDMLRASLLQATNTGIFPFREEIRGGAINTVPLIDSATVPAKTMILVDAADFVVVGGEAPRLELSDQATLHMEDTTPSDLVSGSPGVVATPQRSLFQTDSIALRMVLPLNWVQRRTGTIAWIQNVTW
jgi:HK97 family phage prohead protease/HK97 family phage major capsid protein